MIPVNLNSNPMKLVRDQEKWNATFDLHITINRKDKQPRNGKAIMRHTFK